MTTRKKLVCATPNCGKSFSTNSSNRTVCHTCKPKADNPNKHVPEKKRWAGNRA
jgi:hypothetical protein